MYDLLLLLVVVALTAWVVVRFVRRKRQHRIENERWHLFAVCAIFCTYIVVKNYCFDTPPRLPFDPWEASCLIFVVALCWLQAVIAFWEQRPQFSIRSLLLLTLLVALLCAASHYFDFRLVLFVAFVAYLLVYYAPNRGCES